MLEKGIAYKKTQRTGIRLTKTVLANEQVIDAAVGVQARHRRKSVRFRATTSASRSMRKNYCPASTNSDGWPDLARTLAQRNWIGEP